MKKFHRPLVLLAALLLIPVWITIWNYYTLSRPLAAVKKSNSTFSDIDVSVHYKYYVLPSELVFDVKKTSASTPGYGPENMFIAFAIKLHNKNFDTVHLASKGQIKFQVSGYNFNQLNEVFISTESSSNNAEEDLETVEPLAKLIFATHSAASNTRD